MELKISTQSGQAAGVMNVSEPVFGGAFNEPLVHQVVTAYLAGGRAGTSAQKTRTQVRGGGAKPWKQKGTGRARAGSTRSPLWRGGGRIFAAVPRDHSQKVNKKMHGGAMRAILAELVRQDRLMIIDDFGVSGAKTKDLVAKLRNLGAEKCLIVTEAFDQNLFLSGRNLANVFVTEVEHADPVSLVSFEKVLVTVGAVKKFEEVLG